jgi:hypothetical protein
MIYACCSLGLGKLVLICRTKENCFSLLSSPPPQVYGSLRSPGQRKRSEPEMERVWSTLREGGREGVGVGVGGGL